MGDDKVRASTYMGSVSIDNKQRRGRVELPNSGTSHPVLSYERMNPAHGHEQEITEQT